MFSVTYPHFYIISGSPRNGIVKNIEKGLSFFFAFFSFPAQLFLKKKVVANFMKRKEFSIEEKSLPSSSAQAGLLQAR